MVPRNCLTYALDAWHEHGGYFVARRSSHWGMPHVLHMTKDGEIASYSPPEKLRKPVCALVGFDGSVVEGDKATLASPISMFGIVAGSWALAFGSTWWAFSRCFLKIKKKSYHER
jgi:hypothetical protein